MNFLEICQQLRQWSGKTASGSDSPTTVVSQTGELRNLVNWVISAYRNIQTSKLDWLWLRSRFTIQTVADTDSYAYGTATDEIAAEAVSRFSRWWPFTLDGENNVTCYLTATGVSDEQELDFMTWPEFRRVYKRGTQTSGRPINFTIDPQKKLVLGPAPDAVYTISGEYQKGPQILAADEDEPEMPAEFHDLIVWRALLDYSSYAVAPEVYAHAQAQAGNLRDRLELDQLPPISGAPALA